MYGFLAGSNAYNNILRNKNKPKTIFKTIFKTDYNWSLIPLNYIRHKVLNI